MDDFFKKKRAYRSVSSGMDGNILSALSHINPANRSGEMMMMDMDDCEHGFGCYAKQM
jgi:hypothetical protein